MQKTSASVPRVLPISPLTIPCPFCNARPNLDCETSPGGLAVVHVARVQAAAAIDKASATRRPAH